jgi:hypothetical protein
MSKKDDELNDFVDEVTDGVYNLPCVEVILKIVKQIQTWGDERIKNIMVALVAKGMKISSLLIYGTRIRIHEHTFYKVLFRIPVKKIYFFQVRAQ